MIDMFMHMYMTTFVKLKRSKERRDKEIERRAQNDTTPTYEYKKFEDFYYIEEFVKEALKEPTRREQLIKYNELTIDYLERKSYLWDLLEVPHIYAYQLSNGQFRKLVNSIVVLSKDETSNVIVERRRK